MNDNFEEYEGRVEKAMKEVLDEELVYEDSKEND